MATSSILLTVPLAKLEMKQETFRYLFLIYLVVGIAAYLNLYQKLQSKTSEITSLPQQENSAHQGQKQESPDPKIDQP